MAFFAGASRRWRLGRTRLIDRHDRATPEAKPCKKARIATRTSMSEMLLSRRPPQRAALRRPPTLSDMARKKDRSRHRQPVEAPQARERSITPYFAHIDALIEQHALSIFLFALVAVKLVVFRDFLLLQECLSVQGHRQRLDQQHVCHPVSHRRLSQNGRHPEMVVLRGHGTEPVRRPDLRAISRRVLSGRSGARAIRDGLRRAGEGDSRRPLLLSLPETDTRHRVCRDRRWIVIRLHRLRRPRRRLVHLLIRCAVHRPAAVRL